MGVAAVAGDAKVRESTPWIGGNASYLWQVKALKEYEGNGKILFIATVDILEAKGEGEGFISAGVEGGYCVDCAKFGGSMAGDVKVFLGNLMGLDPETVDGQAISVALSSQQPCSGMLIRANTWLKPQKQNPAKNVTRYKFSAATQEDVQRAPSLRSALNLPPLPVRTL